MPKLYFPLKKWIAYVFIYFFLVFIPAILYCQIPVLSYDTVISSGLSSPLDIVNAADGSNRLFIVEQGGLIKYARGLVVKDTIFLNLSGIISTGGERGLLSMAFHPNFSTNGYFFVYYTNLLGDITIARYHVSSDPNLADPASGQVLLTIPHRSYENHNGGKLNFGADGNLYFATGDGGSGGDPNFNAQRGDTLLGKMIRVNVNGFATSAPFYTIPAGNPWAAEGDNIKNEIWAFGLRNPFRWSFDRLTHDMWIGDVGQGAREEIDFRPDGSTGGINYGWRCFEGNLVYNDSGCLASANYVFPIFDYNRTNATGGRTVTGGIVYRGSAYPGLSGWYVCIDFFSTNGWVIKSNGSGGWTIQQQSGLPTSIAGFGEDENGELYAVSLDGVIFRVSSSGSLPLKLQRFSALTKNGMHEISWRTATEQNLRQFEIQFSSDGNVYQTIGIVPARNSNNGDEYSFNYPIPLDEKIFYRLKIIDNNDKVEYSNIIKLEGRNDLSVWIAPTLVKNGRVGIQLNKAFKNMSVVDMNGRILILKHLNQTTGMINLDVSGLPKGMFLIRLQGDKTEVHRKIIIQ